MRGGARRVCEEKECEAWGAEGSTHCERLERLRQVPIFCIYIHIYHEACRLIYTHAYIRAEALEGAACSP